MECIEEEWPPEIIDLSKSDIQIDVCSYCYIVILITLNGIVYRTSQNQRCFVYGWPNRSL